MLQLRDEVGATLHRIAGGTAVVAGVFSLVVAILMITNYIRLETTDPLDNPSLLHLLERLYTGGAESAGERDQLMSDIRALDVLSRRAYFTAKWQIQSGAYLLAGGVVLLLVCLKGLQLLGPKPPEPDDATADTLEASRRRSRWAVGIGGTLIFAFAVVSAVLSRGILAREYTLPSEDGSPSIPKITDVASVEDILKNWPNYRGPFGLGISGAGEAPLDWDGESGRGVLWKTPVPLPGYGSPIVWEKRIFLSGADERKREVYCFDADTGELLWSGNAESVAGSPATSPEVSSDTGYAAPTMATDGERVYAVFANGDVVSFDFTGNRMWGRNLGVPDNLYGHASSLLVYRSLLIVQYDHDGGARVMGLDSASGATVWETPREVYTSWATPIIARDGAAARLILSANPLVAFYDPETGEELWSMELLFGEIAPSPAYSAGRVYVAAQFAVMAAIDVESGDILWVFREDLPDVSSPLATEDYVILATGYGVVTCLDAESGEVRWLHEFEDGFYASPVKVGEHIFLLDKKGIMRVFRADPEFELVASPSLGEASLCTPAFSEGRIYIRGNEHLYGIDGDGSRD